jgi:hypothetical protein
MIEITGSAFPNSGARVAPRTDTCLNALVKICELVVIEDTDEVAGGASKMTKGAELFEGDCSRSRDWRGLALKREGDCHGQALLDGTLDHSPSPFTQKGWSLVVIVIEEKRWPCRVA